MPNALKTSANSQPTAPAPTMAIVAGAFSRNSASVLEKIVLPLKARPIAGMSLGREPVAMTTALFAVSSCTPASVFTETFLPALSVPAPLNTSTLFFFIR